MLGCTLRNRTMKDIHSFIESLESQDKLPYLLHMDELTLPMSAITIPFKNYEGDEWERAERVAFKLWETCIHKPYLNLAKTQKRNVIRVLKHKAPLDSHNIFKLAIISDSPALFEKVVTDTSEIIGNQHTLEMLIQPTDKGYTALSKAVAYGNLEMIQKVIALTNHYLRLQYPREMAPQKKERAAIKAYNEYICARTPNSVNLLVSAINSGDLDVIHFVFGHVKSELSKGFPELAPEQRLEKVKGLWKSMLGTLINGNLSLLHKAVDTENPEIISFIAEEMGRNLQAEIPTFLTSKNSKGITLPQLASGKKKYIVIKPILELYEKYMPREQYHSFLVENPNAVKHALINALDSGNREMLDAVHTHFSKFANGLYLQTIRNNSNLLEVAAIHHGLKKRFSEICQSLGVNTARSQGFSGRYSSREDDYRGRH